jgi:hypothetical protein
MVPNYLANIAPASALSPNSHTDTIKVPNYHLLSTAFHGLSPVNGYYPTQRSDYANHQYSLSIISQHASLLGLVSRPSSTLQTMEKSGDVIGITSSRCSESPGQKDGGQRQYLSEPA